MDVTLYTSPGCGYCNMVKDYLNRKNVKFKEINAKDDYKGFMEKTGVRGVPVVIAEGKKVVGFDRAELDKIFG
jgi:glutaredoxin 3